VNFIMTVKDAVAKRFEQLCDQRGIRPNELATRCQGKPTIQQAFERFQKYNRLKNLSQGSLDFYAAKGRSFFRFLGDTEQSIHTITEETVEDYIFYMKDQKLHDIGNSEQIISVCY
jgi:hypothetical protein